MSDNKQHKENKTRLSDIHVDFPCDLRMGRAERMERSSVFHKWSAFVNNRGTLCYLTAPEAGLHTAFEFYEPVKEYTTEYIREIIQKRIDKFLVV